MFLANIFENDLPVFTNITSNLFPDTTLPETKNNVLIKAIKQSMSNNNIQPSNSAILKVLQLYEIKRFRNSVILIGRSGAAKSTTWKTLRDTLTLLKRERVNTFETVIVSYNSIDYNTLKILT